MINCVSIDEMKYFDAKTIEIVGSTTLMERAAKAVYEEIKDRDKKVYIISGGGNNGGDGIALLNLFIKDGYKPYLYLASSHLSNDSQFFFDKLNGYNLIKDISECDYDADIIVDCILGTGFSGEVKENIKGIINSINASKAHVISVDIASGLSGQSGVAKCAVKADKTIAIQFAKYGHYLQDGKDYSGEIIIKDIGIKAVTNTMKIIEDKDIFFKERKFNSNKSTFGKATVIGGCKNYVGAIKIANMGVSALRIGAGLNVLAIPESIKDYVAPQVVESTLMYLKDNDGYLAFDKEKLDEIVKTSSAIAIGPGMGPNKTENNKIIKYIIENAKCKVLIDADGLNAFEGEGKYFIDKENVVITPHPKEFSRLFNLDMQALLEDEVNILNSINNKCTILLKGTSTIVKKNDEKYMIVNGTSALAKGGSGDTLSGVILGLLTQGYDCEVAAYMGAYLCAKAATNLEKDYSQYGVLASDVAKEVSKLVDKG